MWHEALASSCATASRNDFAVPPVRQQRGDAIALDLRALPDARLVVQARAGAQPAFREIVRRYERPVRSLILRMVRDPALAEDLAQDTFLKAFRSLSSFDASRTFSSWLFRIANNTAIDAIRRRPHGQQELEGRAQLDPAVPPAPDPVEEAALGQALEAALGRLRADHRMAVLLRYQEGCSYPEIAETLSIPEGTAKTYVHRGRKLLAQWLEQAGWRPAGRE
jgi:RNA polymerase sigma-70 factor, ECF subfamily